MEKPQWYRDDPSRIFQELRSRETGLTNEEAHARLSEFGPNKLLEAKRKSIASIFFDQFRSPLIYVLLGADIVVFVLREFTDGFIILFILLFNAILGTIQEGRAENTLSKLARFVETRAEVLRDGRELNVPDADLVPGDIILLQEGEKVPADARILEARNLNIDEAALTGESEPVHKIADVIAGENLPVAEEKNMLFKGSTVVGGTGRALVVATGSGTVIGKISKAISGTNTEIPLAKNLKQIARVVVAVVAVLIVAIFAIGVVEGNDFREMFVAAVAIAVAAVPEGLPLVLTVTLAAGVWRMARKKVLVKKLQAVEALGEAQEFAVDKTGTITKNELVIQRIVAGGREFAVEGVGYEPAPKIKNPSAEIELAGRIAAFCSNAHLAYDEEKKSYRLIGDPTEGAMTAFAWKAGLQKKELEKTWKPIRDWPFDYGKKFHLALYEREGKPFLATTGAPEVILGLSRDRVLNGARSPLDPAARRGIEERFLALSSEGLRVIAFAFMEEAPRDINPDSLPPLTFGGLIAMRDALRTGIREDIERAKQGGLRVFMVTGDHAVTAKAIAREAGIYREGDSIMTGAELDTLGEREFDEKLGKTTVFARVTPEHKMKIIQSYRRQGKIIAMTGDGVNDAPSLVAADLGIAMGKIGTEVAKEASDLVLLEDNFGDILAVVEEGRNLRQGIRRTITYLFSSNIGEILLIATALLARDPIPLLAAQLIWMNVVTDTFFDISLALEPKDSLLMRAGTRIRKRLIDRLMVVRLLTIAPVIALGSFLFYHSNLGDDPTRARTIALTSLIIFQWFNSWNCRSEERSIFTLNPFSNKFLLGTLFGVASLHLFALYHPFMNNLLKIEPLSMEDIGRIALVAVSVIIVEEVRKYFYRRSFRKETTLSPARGI